MTSAVAKLVMKEKASLKLGLGDLFYAQQAKGTINSQQTQVAQTMNQAD